MLGCCPKRPSTTVETGALAVAEHGQMVERLAARDGPGLRAVLTAHVHHKRDVVLEQLRAAARALH